MLALSLCSGGALAADILPRSGGALAAGLTIRTRSDMRLWQTVFDRTEPLAWMWAEGADAATVTFGRYHVAEVVREPGSERGCCEMAAPHGYRRVVREFDGPIVADEVWLNFGLPGFMISIR